MIDASVVSYSIVWWIQAAQASYSGEAQHQKKVRCATIGIPTLDRLRLHSAGYSSEEGLGSEDEIDEDKWIHNESCDTSTLKVLRNPRPMGVHVFDFKKPVVLISLSNKGFRRDTTSWRSDGSKATSFRC